MTWLTSTSHQTGKDNLLLSAEFEPCVVSYNLRGEQWVNNRREIHCFGRDLNFQASSSEAHGFTTKLTISIIQSWHLRVKTSWNESEWKIKKSNLCQYFHFCNNKNGITELNYKFKLLNSINTFQKRESYYKNVPVWKFTVKLIWQSDTCETGQKVTQK